MSKFNEEKWLADEKLMACRLDAASLPGGFLKKKYLKVPPLCKALVTMPRGKTVIKCEGAGVEELTGAVLVKTCRFDLEFTKPGLVSSEAYVGECSLILTFMAGDRDVDMEQVADNLLKGRNQIRIADIHAFLDEAIEELLQTFVSQRSAEEVCQKPVAQEFQNVLRKGLEKLLFRGGLTLCELKRLEFRFPDFKKVQVELSHQRLDDVQDQRRKEQVTGLIAIGVDPDVAAKIVWGQPHCNAARAKLLLVASGQGEAYIETSGRPRGGFNSVALAHGAVYASHSELGLLYWESEKEPGQPVFAGITRANKYTRGVCIHDGAGYFSSGAKVYSFEPGSSRITATYRNGNSPITALLVAGNSIFAGNQNGEVLHWHAGHPKKAAEVLLRKQGIIYAVGKMNTDRGTFLLIGAKDYSVTAFEPLSGMTRQYISPDFVRWVDGAGDYVFASSYSGHRVFVWDTSQESRHLYSIPVDEMTQDIYVWEEGPE
jgi:hypothetical protein